MAEHRYEDSYTGPVYVRPIGRGIVLPDADGRPHIEDWIARALREAGVLDDADSWLAGGRTTEPVTLTVRIERRLAP